MGFLIKQDQRGFSETIFSCFLPFLSLIFLSLFLGFAWLLKASRILSVCLKVFVVVFVLLFYVLGKHLWSCRDG